MEKQFARMSLFYYIGKFAVKPPGFGNMEDCYERKNEVIWF